MVVDDEEKANILNTFFSTVFTVENEMLGEIPRNNENPILRVTNLTQEEVRNRLNKIKIDKSPGPDGIHPRVLRELSNVIDKPLFLIFRDSIATGSVPQDWRIANVVPIFKKGSKSEPGNYRPVSLTSIVGKIFEGFLRDVILDYLNENNCLTPYQHGFMRNRSCQTNLISFYEEVSYRLDHGESLDVVYLDFSKAFDTVPHKRLVHKMRMLGLGENVCKWVSNWLSDRKQRVVINGIVSNWVAVTSGVPQGSILGPVLFNIFINDLVEGLHSKISIFADDTKLCKAVNTREDSILLQMDLDKLETWAERWQKRFNNDKCKVIHMGRRNQCHHYTLNGKPLDKSDREKDLGILVNDKLTWSSQCQAAAAKANRIMGTRLRKAILHSAGVYYGGQRMNFNPILQPACSQRTRLSDAPVQSRGLVTTEIKAKDIVLHHQSYCSKQAKERHVSGDVLGYVTPWNGHGYDVAKAFASKFTLISPVWLQIRRKGRQSYQVTGLHDIDQGWIKDIKKNSKSTQMVPRVLFDSWTYQDFESVFSSEDEIEDLSDALLQTAKRLQVAVYHQYRVRSNTKEMKTLQRGLVLLFIRGLLEASGKWPPEATRVQIEILAAIFLKLSATEISICACAACGGHFPESSGGPRLQEDGRRETGDALAVDTFLPQAS
ncbi:unnamed protein product [Ranitomeya imitator]|uniref:Reverse transcriptase domain-containing protein n=1 Tax=Ranitomeya imitator TaxID=111125 RepID=A0ABN9L0Q3_9NEOB|nr:unnamed protein product [Ranitomeya imitator]